jgi:hypothetical protein
VSEAATWKRCSSCKEPIALGATYWVCSVSTCNRARTALQFCSVSCWDAHLPIARHREAWAEERRAPATAATAPAAAAPKPRAPRRILTSAAPSPPAPAPTPAASAAPEEILIVASRLKDFVRAESGFNTSDRVLEPLSAIVRRVCREAIENARRDGRKTVLDRDVPRS